MSETTKSGWRRGVETAEEKEGERWWKVRREGGGEVGSGMSGGETRRRVMEKEGGRNEKDTALRPAGGALGRDDEDV